MNDDDLVTVMLCINDPESGRFTGQLVAVDFFGDGSTLCVGGSRDPEGKDWCGIAFGESTMRIGSHVRGAGSLEVPIHGREFWVRDGSWDSVQVDHATLARMISFLSQATTWVVDWGQPGLRTMWAEGRRFTRMDVRQCLEVA